MLQASNKRTEENPLLIREDCEAKLVAWMEFISDNPPEAPILYVKETVMGKSQTVTLSGDCLLKILEYSIPALRACLF